MKSFVFISFFFVFMSGFSQENELDKKYTPPTNSIFNNLFKKNTNSSNSNSEITAKNSVGFIMTALLRQKVVFNYQRELYKGLTLSTSLGKAFGKDIIQSVGFQISETDFSPNNLTSTQLMSAASFDESSLYFNGGIRYYYSGKSFEDGYLDLNFSHERFQYVLTKNVGGYEVRGSGKAEFIMNGFSAGLGQVFAIGTNNNVFHDIYIGAGVNFFKYSKFEKVDQQNTSGYSQQPYYNSTSAYLNAKLFSLYLRYTLSFGF